MTTKVPRAVVVTRATEYEALLLRHATREQARFFLQTRGQDIALVQARHDTFVAALQIVLGSIPLTWRRSRIDRSDLHRFLFEPDDIVVIVGQDGLVANVAKYLDGQRVIGINPDRDRYDGVLVTHAPDRTDELLVATAGERIEVEARTLVEGRLDDGQRLLALNEIFVGHCTHQSARYRIRWATHEETHSSSGLIVATGTGATGWARSIHRQTKSALDLPCPTDPTLAFFVREAFPSRVTGTDVTEGMLAPGQPLEIRSEMQEGGVVFGDGIESDRLDFAWGTTLTVQAAAQRLRLVTAA